MDKRLYRSKQNRVISGVCGGIGEYFNIDPTIIRILWVATSFAGGSGLIAYIIALIIIPEGDFEHYNQADNAFDGVNDGWKEPVKYDTARTNFLMGGILILVGVLFIVREFVPHWVTYNFMFPGILIIIGAAILFRGRRY